MSVRAYPAYKDSGAQWISKIPDHWTHGRIKDRFMIVSGATPKTDDATLWDGGIVWITPGDLGGQRPICLISSSRSISDAGIQSSAVTLVPSGSIVISTRAPIGSLGLAGTSLCTNQGCRSLVPVRGVSARFYLYALSICAHELNIRGRGTTFLELSADALGSFPVPIPPPAEQSAIAAFLDRETGKIDALVAEQERLMALLKEKRQAVISQAVTKGLDLNAKMKPSGVEWLGDVPARWKITPLKWLTDPDRPIMYGIVLPGPDVGEGIPILKGGNVKPSKMNLQSMARTTAEIEAPFARARLKTGDLVYSIRGTIGDCEPVPAEMDGANITQDVARVAIAEGVCAVWARWALLASAVRDDLAKRSAITLI